MYIIDTNIHVAYLLQEDFENDVSTKKYLETYKTMPLAERVIPDFILGEFETLIMQVVPSRYRLNPEDKQKLKLLAVDYIYRLTHECTIVAPDISIVQRARDLYFENIATHYLSFVDCLVLATAEQYRYAIFTKDDRMKLVARQNKILLHEPRITP